MDAIPDKSREETQLPEIIPDSALKPLGVKSILAVDDDPAWLTLLSSILGEGYGVLTATNGRSALEQAEGKSLDAVLLDWRLPGMGGLEVLKLLKKSYPALP